MLSTGRSAEGEKSTIRWPVVNSDAPSLALAIAVAVGCLVFAVAALTFGLGERAGNATALSYGLAVAACVALLGLRYGTPSRAAVAVTIVVITIRIAVAWSIDNELALMPVTAIALYTVARSGDRRTSLSIAAVAGTALAIVIAVLAKDHFAEEFIGEWVVNMLPIAVADAVRGRSDRVQLLIDTEADRRVEAERLRIARDLHDVVAHGLSTIAVQSGVAAHLFDDDPGQAKEALEIINATGRNSLEELRTMVGVLRSTDSAPLRPMPTNPDDLATVIEGAVQAGVMVSAEVDGVFPPTATDGSIVAVHRIVQEALTNVARHAGPVAATVRLQHGQHQVTVSVSNEPAPSRPAHGSDSHGGGVGIIGMTERAEALGGTLRAGPTAAGGFNVTATIPYAAADTPGTT